MLAFLTFSQLIASKGLGDVGAIASAQAAEIYGLHILEDKIQVIDVFYHKKIVLCTLALTLGCPT